MNKFMISYKIIFYVIIISVLFVRIGVSSENKLKEANILFDNGKYLESVNLVSKNNSIESYIFSAKTLAIYGHFLLEGEEAKQVFKKAREFAFLALENDYNNDNAHLEAAHTMGRYSQSIGILSALKEGYAEKISFHLDEAIKINPKNILAQISKGTWHAEIVDKAGFMANILYGATADQARIHYEKALKLNKNDLGVFYEIAYGLFLLDEKDDISKAKKLLKKVLDSDPKSHLDKIYIKKSKELTESFQ